MSLTILKRSDINDWKQLSKEQEPENPNGCN